MSIKNIIISLNLVLIIGIFSACQNDDDNRAYEETVAIANRASGSISFINARTDEVEKTLSIPGSAPMYVVYVPSTDKIYVGDRAQNIVHVINPETRAVEDIIQVGNGVFHMWADGQGKQLWVNNDIDNTVSVIDLSANAVVKTIDLGIKPHDVFLNDEATYAYISIITESTEIPDSIYQFSIADYTKINAQAVGKDPHVFHLSNSNKLYVPCQSGIVYALDGNDISEISKQSLTGAHGIFTSPNQEYMYLTNISGQQIYGLDASNNTLKSTAKALEKTPHNVAINSTGNKMFVTHSGPTANTVSTYSAKNGVVSPRETINVGTNPFGLVYYRRLVTKSPTSSQNRF